MMAAVAVSRVLFERQVSREVDELFAVSGDARPAVLTDAEIADLPAPVQRWLRVSQVVGKERAVTVRLKQEGDFRLGEGKDWVPFSAEQYITTGPPGFVWTASIQMYPLVSIIGRDRYIGGEGDMQMKLLGLIPVVDKQGGGLNQGAMLRYLGEIGWYPAAVVSPYITWEAIDATMARATMSYDGVTASMTFRFDGEGRLAEVRAERFNDDKGRLVDWSGRTIAYGEPGGVPLPVEMESVWHYETGDHTPIRLRITEIEYNRPEEY
jgi:hypothetical protein